MVDAGATDANADDSTPRLRLGTMKPRFKCLNGLPKTRPRLWDFRAENSLGPDKHSNPPGDMWGETWTLSVRLDREHPQAGRNRTEPGKARILSFSGAQHLIVAQSPTDYAIADFNAEVYTKKVFVLFVVDIFSNTTLG